MCVVPQTELRQRDHAAADSGFAVFKQWTTGSLSFTQLLSSPLIFLLRSSSNLLFITLPQPAADDTYIVVEASQTFSLLLFFFPSRLFVPTAHSASVSAATSLCPSLCLSLL